MMDAAKMVDIWIEEVEAKWYAAAYAGERLVATAVAPSHDRIENSILRHIPQGLPRRIVDSPSGFASRAILMLSEIESGDERNKRYALAEELLPDHLRRVLLAAAAVPLGYVTSYGKIAEVSAVIARTVGHIMATNPLYPIVACHRIVGSDMSLVGYGGHQDAGALRSKLRRLQAEARGFGAGEAHVLGSVLPLYPVEMAISRAAGTAADPSHQLTLFE